LSGIGIFGEVIEGADLDGGAQAAESPVGIGALEIADVGAAVGESSDPAVLGEFGHGLSYGDHADAEFAGDASFGDALACLEGAVKDLGQDRGIDTIGEAGVDRGGGFKCFEGVRQV